MKTLKTVAAGLLLAMIVSACGESTSSLTGGLECVASSSFGSTATNTQAATVDLQAVVDAAIAFEATLSSTQQNNLIYDLSLTEADNWSNLPVGNVQRNGLEFSELTTDQIEAALMVAQAAFSDAGYATFQGLRAADEYLSTQGGGGGGPGGGGGLAYGEDLYYIAFLGSPSTTDPWILQLGGHHYAIQFSYHGEIASPTPNFVGLEPLSFTLDGTSYAPMAERAETFVAVFNALSSSELSSAQLSGQFNGIVVGPGEDFNFPDQEGLRVSSLTQAQQDLVTAAISAWVLDADDDLAASLIDTYTSAEAFTETFIGYANASGLTTQGSYLRIDGPRVWIEISGEGGIVLSGVHYHGIWRDKSNDYGGIFSTTGTGTEDAC